MPSPPSPGFTPKALYDAFQGPRIENFESLNRVIEEVQAIAGTPIRGPLSQLKNAPGQAAAKSSREPRTGAPLLGSNSFSNRRLLVYRGVDNCEYGFFSSLYRRLWWKQMKTGKPDPPDEGMLSGVEHEILVAMNRWGLHESDRGRLSVLRQLAIAQHHHVPTRMIDVSLNLYVALWFAAEQKWTNGTPVADNVDGRLFAIDVTKRLINERPRYRSMEDDLERPWRVGGSVSPYVWQTQAFAWIPSSLDRRIAAQNGAFLFGGVPISRSRHQYPATTKPGSLLTQDQLRRCTSVPLRFHKAGSQVGRPPANPTYTYRVASEFKQELRIWLRDIVGLDSAHIYPDYAGFGTFGTPYLPVHP